MRQHSARGGDPQAQRVGGVDLTRGLEDFWANRVRNGKKKTKFSEKKRDVALVLGFCLDFREEGRWITTCKGVKLVRHYRVWALQFPKGLELTSALADRRETSPLLRHSVSWSQKDFPSKHPTRSPISKCYLFLTSH